MSLFDVIKYSGTDLRSTEELKSLPQALVYSYWCMAANYVHQKPSLSKNNMIHETLSYWYAWKCLPRKHMKSFFDKALMEYDNESL